MDYSHPSLTDKFPNEFEKMDFSKYDLIITNPPFSKIRTFIKKIIKDDVKFIILVPPTIYKFEPLFNLFKYNKCFASNKGRCKYFDRPDGTIANVSATWITNIEGVINQEFLDLEKWNEQDILNAQKYDNYDALEVSRSKNIPANYDGLMGVPITFLEFYNPAQFEILSIENKLKLNGKNLFARIIIKKRGVINND